MLHHFSLFQIRGSWHEDVQILQLFVASASFLQVTANVAYFRRICKRNQFIIVFRQTLKTGRINCSEQVGPRFHVSIFLYAVFKNRRFPLRLKLNIFVLITNKMQKTSTFVIVPMVTLRCVEMVHGDGQFSQGAIYIDTWTLSPVFERRTSR